MTEPATLRERAEGLAAPLPALLAEAEHLAATVLLGDHGRRRAGMGDEFWQYRPATGSDEARTIDWRRSARSDQHFVREKEWQAAQSVQMWVDDAASMRFTGDRNRPTKGERARLLSLALAVLLVRGGERVGLFDFLLRPARGELQLMRLAEVLSRPEGSLDYGAPEARGMLPQSRAVFVSDFLGDLGAIELQLGKAADRGVRGAMVMVLDPQEELFPFDGRTIFESMAGTVSFETLKAGDLKARYLGRLAERKVRLQELARLTGWQVTVHHTGDAPLPALLWLYRALERRV
jgi:uncharacterized protein (DUF58 family)